MLPKGLSVLQQLLAEVANFASEREQQRRRLDQIERSIAYLSSPVGVILNDDCKEDCAKSHQRLIKRVTEPYGEPEPTYSYKVTFYNSTTGVETSLGGKPQPIGKDIVAKLAELTPTKLEYSEYTNCFYVHTNAEIGGDSFLCGITEHRATKEEAYEAFAQRITNLPQGKHLVIDAMKDSRKHYTWNGSEFVQIDEVTRKDVTP
jgi:hypothetical protein